MFDSCDSENADFHAISRMGLGRNGDLVTSIWLGPCNGFGDFQGRSVSWRGGCSETAERLIHGGSGLPLSS